MNRSLRRSPFRRWAARALIPALLLALPWVAACGPGPESGGGPSASQEPGGSFGYQAPPSDPSAPEVVQEPLLELRYEGGIIKNPDPTPFVRVYPGGRVRIHYPAYMKKAGDYELQLDDAELQELLSSFADRDVLTTESGQLEALAADVRADQELADVLDDHGVKTVVEIRADSFTAAGEQAPTLLEIDHTLTAQGLPSLEALEATTDPQFRRLQLFTRGVRELEALGARPDLEPIEPSDADRRNP